MPLIRNDDQLHYLAHVLKYAGVSVEQCLMMRFGLLGFQCSTFVPTPRYLPCSSTAPLHAPLNALEDFAAQKRIAGFFAMLSDQITLLTPTFKIWQCMQFNKIGQILNHLMSHQIKEFSKKLLIYKKDFMPKIAFLSHIVVIFKMENGCGRIAAHSVKPASKHANMRSIQQNQCRPDKNSDGEINTFDRQCKMVSGFHAKTAIVQACSKKPNGSRGHNVSHQLCNMQIPRRCDP